MSQLYNLLSENQDALWVVGCFTGAILLSLLNFKINLPWLRQRFAAGVPSRPEWFKGLGMILHRPVQDLEAGRFPAWEQVFAALELQGEWARWIGHSLQVTRSQGAAVLPILRQWIRFADRYQKGFAQVRAAAIQAEAQAVLIAGLIPILALALYGLLPELTQESELWLSASSVSVLLALGAWTWIRRQGQGAAWGGLSETGRVQFWKVLMTLESLWAQVCAGCPADLAWQSWLESTRWPELGPSLWVESRGLEGKQPWVQTHLQTVRRILRNSVLEGVPCADLLEKESLDFQDHFQSQVELERQLLGLRLLKPLFLLILPGCLGLLVLALWVYWRVHAAEDLGQ